MTLVICLFEDWYFEGSHMAKYANKDGFICAESFHRFAESVRLSRSVELYHLTRYITW